MKPRQFKKNNNSAKKLLINLFPFRYEELCFTFDKYYEVLLCIHPTRAFYIWGCDIQKNTSPDDALIIAIKELTAISVVGKPFHRIIKECRKLEKSGVKFK